MCAMPPIIIVISSESVILAMYGRTVSGASVWPMNTLAQTLVVSAPDTRMTLVIAQAMTLHDRLHHARGGTARPSARRRR